MKHMMAGTNTATTTLKIRAPLLALTALASLWLAAPAQAQTQPQNYPVTPAQRATAQQVAQAGVPIGELAPNAPDSYTVKRGDTLWAISGLYLKRPWRWPELWGMNLQEIRNPNLIYPGQNLYLDKSNGRAQLRMGRAENGAMDTVRLSPHTRYETLAGNALPTLRSDLIEPFLAEPVIIDENGLAHAPRIVATQENRVLLTRGDRAYARGDATSPLQDDQGKPSEFRVFRNATPLKDPDTGAVLGYEAQYLGKARLVRGESTSAADSDGKAQADIVPATIDIVSTKEEIRVGDRLLPEPPRQFLSYTPHAPQGKVTGRIVSVYGSAVVNAAQNQVVVINRGTSDGMESGDVLAILKDGQRLVDPTDPAKAHIKLPDERNGLLMVFRPFEKLSYALILEITDGVKVGDRVVNPR
ncbi:MAG: LysM domain-containing protein [Rhodoferax sp.]|nr:LysM domain-containing protein [Rhodoferax sp.]